MLSEATELRADLAYKALDYAALRGIPYYLSLGTPPTVMFEPYANGQLHGNFLPASYAAIQGHENWKRRLAKPHQRAGALPVEKRGTARELDSSNSSDALLMNVFCHPGIAGCEALARLFELPAIPLPEFGVPGNVPLAGGRVDSTQIDMRLGSILVESKLTESGFTSKRKDIALSYRDFGEVFNVAALPQSDGEFHGYQLIRNFLAARAAGGSSFVIVDERRPSLRVAWEGVVEALKVKGLRSRCLLLYWQQVAAAVPGDLRDFLIAKYGILPQERSTWAG